MTTYQRTVLKLLTMIWWAVTSAPGVARHTINRKYVEDLEKKLGIGQ